MTVISETLPAALDGERVDRVVALLADVSRSVAAQLVIDGAVNGELFRAYVERVLMPELRRGDVVVMDNLASHTVAGVRQMLEGAGCELLYLPPYSPDLNPIENAFSKLKRLLSSAAERAVEALWDRIGQLLDRFQPDECRNYLRHCGYPCTFRRSRWRR